MEEVLVQHPENDHYMVKLAQLYATLGGKDNVKHAIKYFSHVVSRYPKNTRALWGLYRTLQSQGDKIEADNVELRQVILYLYSYASKRYTSNTAKEIPK